MSATPQRKRLLIIDDDDGILSRLSFALEESYDVVVARNGEEGLAVLTSQPVDAVVLDLMMPVLDGAGFLREFQARRLDVPVLIASAGGGMDLAWQARHLGAQDWVAKPFDLRQFEEKLASLIGGRPPRDAAS